MAYYVDVTLVGAWCELRNGYRNFRVERIQSSKVLDELFDQDNGRLFREWSELPKVKPDQKYRRPERSAAKSKGLFRFNGLRARRDRFDCAALGRLPLRMTESLKSPLFKSVQCRHVDDRAAAPAPTADCAASCRRKAAVARLIRTVTTSRSTVRIIEMPDASIMPSATGISASRSTATRTDDATSA